MGERRARKKGHIHMFVSSLNKFLLSFYVRDYSRLSIEHSQKHVNLGSREFMGRGEKYLGVKLHAEEIQGMM